MSEAALLDFADFIGAGNLVSAPMGVLTKRLLNNPCLPFLITVRIEDPRRIPGLSPVWLLHSPWAPGSAGRVPRCNRGEGGRAGPRAGSSRPRRGWVAQVRADRVEKALMKYGVQRFTVRGLTNVTGIALLMAVTHNLSRWAALTA